LEWALDHQVLDDRRVRLLSEDPVTTAPSERDALVINDTGVRHAALTSVWRKSSTAGHRSLAMCDVDRYGAGSSCWYCRGSPSRPGWWPSIVDGGGETSCGWQTWWRADAERRGMAAFVPARGHARGVAEAGGRLAVSGEVGRSQTGLPCSRTG
jgi:hypothetical protein